MEVAKATGAGNLGGDHLAFSYDDAKEHKAQNIFEDMEKNLGGVYLLVNAAGINRDSLLVRTKAEAHSNLLGSVLTWKAARKTMIQHQKGSIITVGNSGQSVYSSSKGRSLVSKGVCTQTAPVCIHTPAKGVTRKKITVNRKLQSLVGNVPRTIANTPCPAGIMETLQGTLTPLQLPPHGRKLGCAKKPAMKGLQYSEKCTHKPQECLA
ncbi:hypothetical protein GH733_014845 [Mirounga leonina]|nr:hypothetical protein GH733_014845 [Mirounga leonina]